MPFYKPGPGLEAPRQLGASTSLKSWRQLSTGAGCFLGPGTRQSRMLRYQPIFHALNVKPAGPLHLDHRSGDSHSLAMDPPFNVH